MFYSFGAPHLNISTVEFLHSSIQFDAYGTYKWSLNRQKQHFLLVQQTSPTVVSSKFIPQICVNSAKFLS